MTQRACDLLCELIAMDTRNPSGDERAVCEMLAERLARTDPDQLAVHTVERAAGTSSYTLACYGEPRLLVNAHIDTVPANAGWTSDPLVPARDGPRVRGLGAADNKAAVAALITAAEAHRPRDTALLLSGDEELSNAAMRAFLRSRDAARIERAIVCEPTSRRLGVAHRGISAYRASFRGQGGHSSGADHLPRPIVTLARLAVAIDEIGRGFADRGSGQLRGLCTNVAELTGGVAYNVVPELAQLVYSVRPPPDLDLAPFTRQIESARQAIDDAITIETTLDNPPFRCRQPDWFISRLGSLSGATTNLDFWTEAALLVDAGIDAVVLGPGDIAQAHAPNESISLDDLAWAVGLFASIFGDRSARQ